MPEEDKEVAYLLGAGASHAEITYLAPRCAGILMSDMEEAISSRLSEETEDCKRIKNIFNSPDKPVDIEQIITLYEHDVDKKHHIAANELRTLFREELTSRIVRVLDKQPCYNGCTFHSGLLTALFDMHNIDGIGEKLIAVITTNYDDLIERALQNVYGGFNYTFEIVNNTDEFHINQKIPLMKLHGSFGWRGEYPIELDKPTSLEDISSHSDYIIWAPPGANKSKSEYPFSSIWNKTRELLNCDILRVIGCSLSRNDWLLITLIHDAQMLRKGSHLKVQLLDYPKHAFDIYKNLPYLEIEYIPFKDYFTTFCNDFYSIEIEEQKFVDYLDVDIEKLESQFNNINIFHLWLEATGYYLKNIRKLTLSTDKGFFKTFYKKEESK